MAITMEGEDDDQRKILGSLHSIPPTNKRPAFIYLVTILSAVGGFLFGYDTGVVSGAMIFIRDEFTLSSVWQEVIVSVTVASAWAFALVAGFLADAFGRKPIIILASFIFTTGAILMGVSVNKAMLLCGRLVVGSGIGLASMTVPMYIAEVSPSDIRGILVTVNNLCITFGQFVAALLAGAFSTNTTNGWRFMVGLAGIPSFIQFFGFLLMPESPRWLVSRHKYEEAISVLRKVRGPTANTEEEFEAIKTSCLDIERERKENVTRGPLLAQILRNAPLRRALSIGCMLQMFAQIAGINTVMYYTATIIEMSGVKDKSKAIWLASATAGVNFTVCLIGTFFVEKVGRRLLTLGSMAGVIVSLCVLASGFQIVDNASPKIGYHDIDANASVCYSINSCATCVNNAKCGFCFLDDKSTGYNGTCSIVNDDFTDRALEGPCMDMSNTTLNPTNSTLTFAYQWCPTDVSWIIFLGLLLYLTFFSPGMGSMPWTINAEIYPLWARSTCYSISTSFNWMFNLLISMTFLTLTESLTKYGTFWLYAVLATIGWFIFYFLLPETKGRTLEEMEGLFANSWWRDATTADNKKIVQLKFTPLEDGKPRHDTYGSGNGALPLDANVEAMSNFPQASSSSFSDSTSAFPDKTVQH